MLWAKMSIEEYIWWANLSLFRPMHLDCGEKRKAARSAKVGAREDWEGGDHQHMCAILD